eukprot:2568198-Prorocentrum_lima.AAC.1
MIPLRCGCQTIILLLCVPGSGEPDAFKPALRLRRGPRRSGRHMERAAANAFDLALDVAESVASK